MCAGRRAFDHAGIDVGGLHAALADGLEAAGDELGHVVVIKQCELHLVEIVGRWWGDGGEMVRGWQVGGRSLGRVALPSGPEALSKRAGAALPLERCGGWPHGLLRARAL